MTAPHYSDASVTLYHADCLTLLPELPGCSVDAVVTDPPYGLEFMGREWDGADGFRRSLNPADAGRDSVFGRTSATSREYRTSAARAGMSKPGIGERETGWPSHLGGLNPKCRSCDRWQRGANPCRCETPDFPNERLPRLHTFQQWCQAWAAECLRVLKPGGHMLAFGGTRTYHRLTCAIEDAGFEIRDSIMWVYGSGFAKSWNFNTQYAGPWCECGENALPGERVRGGAPAGDGGDDRAAGDASGGGAPHQPRPGRQPAGEPASLPGPHDALDGGALRGHPACPRCGGLDPFYRGVGSALKPAHEPVVVARKPLVGSVAANVLAWGTGGLNVDGCRVAASGPVQASASGGVPFGPGNYVKGDGRQPSEAAGRWPSNVVLSHLPGCNGVCAAGCGVAELDRQSDGDGASRFFPVFRYEAKAGSGERPREDGAAHPTVKPLDLMRWLVRLVTPPGGLVLEPFAGSGTTAEACVVEGLRCVAVELEAAYLPLVVQRLGKPLQPVLL